MPLNQFQTGIDENMETPNTPAPIPPGKPTSSENVRSSLHNSNSLLKFWLCFLAPLLLSVQIGVLPQENGGSIAGIAFFAMSGLSLFSSIYCGRWLAKRFGKPSKHTLFTILAALGLLVGNLIISIAGCMPHVSFH